MTSQTATLTGILFDLKRYAINDGPGIRTTVFFKGCPLRCDWCHNPESQSAQPELMFRASRCIACGACEEACTHGAIHMAEQVVRDLDKCAACGECAAACYSEARQWIGQRISPAELLAEIERDRPFFESSGGGVTFSGGEPLLQHTFLAAMLHLCKEQEIHTAVDTCGYTPWEKLEAVRREVDLFLYDLKLMDAARHRQYTGVSNRRILANLQQLAHNGAQIVVRMPLVAGINDDADNIQRSADFLRSLPYGSLQGVELAAYHEIGSAKYESLGRRAPQLHAPDPQKLEEIRRVFQKAGLAARIL